MQLLLNTWRKILAHFLQLVLNLCDYFLLCVTFIKRSEIKRYENYISKAYAAAMLVDPSRLRTTTSTLLLLILIRGAVYCQSATGWVADSSGEWRSCDTHHDAEERMSRGWR